MFNRDDERIAAVMRRLPRMATIDATRTGCPGEESLVNYVSGLLSRAARESLREIGKGCAL